MKSNSERVPPSSQSTLYEREEEWEGTARFNLFQNDSDEPVFVRRLALLMSIVEPYQAHLGGNLSSCYVFVLFDPKNRNSNY